MASSLNKTAATSILSLQSVNSNTVVISTAIDVSTKLAGTFLIHFGRRANTALTEGMEFRIEASAKASGDGYWFPAAVFKTRIAAVVLSTVSGTVNAGTNVITLGTTTGQTNQDIVYIDNSTIGNSEWGRIKSISAGTSITLEDNLTNAQTGASVYPSAELFIAQLDLTAITRMRVVANGANTGQAVAVEAYMVTGDSIG